MFEVHDTMRLPYSAVSYIVVNFPNGSSTRGSGVVVGANDVLTAMHVVFDAERGGFASSITIYPGADTSPYLQTPFGSFTNWGGVRSRTDNWDTNGDGLLTDTEAQYDLALIGMRSRIGDVTGWLGLSNSRADVTATMMGYPARGTGLMTELVNADASTFDGVFNMNSGLGAGSSGGPLVSGANQVLGIASAGNASNTIATYAGLFGPGNWDWLMTAMRDNDALIGDAPSPAPATAPAPAPVPGGTSRSGGSSDDSYFFSRFDPAGAITVSDTGGRDIFNAYLLSGHHRINLNAGAPSTIGTNVVTIAFGTVIEDAMAYDGNDILTGNSANNTLWAEGGNDRLIGGGGDDYLDGDVGVDTAVFTGVRASYRVDVARKTVTDLQSGRDGTDTLNSIERLQFSDVSLALDTAGNGGQAYRLYQAAFDRTPDRPGLGYQMNQLDMGARLVDVAQGFINSGEFAQSFADLDTSGFLSRLYQNVFHRAPDASGLAYHTSAAGTGTTRAQLLVNFSESPENQVALIGVIQNGMTFTL